MDFEFHTRRHLCRRAILSTCTSAGLPGGHWDHSMAALVTSRLQYQAIGYNMLPRTTPSYLDNSGQSFQVALLLRGGAGHWSTQATS